MLWKVLEFRILLLCVSVCARPCVPLHLCKNVRVPNKLTNTERDERESQNVERILFGGI